MTVGGSTRGRVRAMSNTSFPLKSLWARRYAAVTPMTTINAVATVATCKESLIEKSTELSIFLFGYRFKSVFSQYSFPFRRSHQGNECTRQFAVFRRLYHRDRIHYWFMAHFGRCCRNGHFVYPDHRIGRIHYTCVNFAPGHIVKHLSHVFCEDQFVFYAGNHLIVC